MSGRTCAPAVPDALVKRCYDCGYTKPASEFSKDKAKSLGLASRCKVCTRTRVAEWKAKNPEKARLNQLASQKRYWSRNKEAIVLKARRAYHEDVSMARAKWVARTYKMKPEQYLRMMAEQDGRCAVCKQTAPEGKKLNVDHCHDTGVVRQLLCNGCNTGLGLLKEDPERILALARYTVHWSQQTTVAFYAKGQLVELSPEVLEIAKSYVDAGDGSGGRT